MSVRVSDLIKSYEDSATSGDFSIWCDKLELVAKLRDITDLPSFVPLFLAGSAFAVYQQLSDEVKKDYSKLKSELMTAFGENQFSAYEHLRSRVLQDGESVDVYLADIRRLAALIGQSNPDPLLRCAFVAGLPVELSIQLKAMVAVEKLDLTELVTRTRMMLTVKQMTPLSCAAGVRSSFSKENIQCHKCSKKGHFARECQTRRPVSKQQIRCYNCQQLGHMARDCPQQGNGGGEVLAPGTSPATSM